MKECDAHVNVPDFPEQCDVCRRSGFDAEKCTVDGCETYVHKRCAAECVGCSKAVCLQHVDIWESDSWCPECLADVRRFEAPVEGVAA